MTSELKPCPFCGGPAKHHDIGNDYTKTRGTQIRCADRLCGFQKTVKAIVHNLDWTREHAFEAWNRRAPSEAVGLLREVERIFTSAYNDEEVGTMLNLSGTIDNIRRFLAAQEGT
jgi:Lar family restriction alleviation protein